LIASGEQSVLEEAASDSLNAEILPNLHPERQTGKTLPLLGTRPHGAIMRKQLWIGLLIGFITYGTSCASVQSQPLARNAQQTARIALAQEFVRELEVLYRLQETAKKELAEDSSTSGKLTTGIRVGTRTLFEMDDSINRLKLIKVDGEWAKFRDMLRQLHQERIVVMQEMNQIAKTMLAGPESGVNYGKLTARAPELTAQVEQINKTMFTLAQAMFFALVDDARVGADGNLHHLLLTKKERTSMVQLIDKIFGPTLEDKNASHIVSAAWAIKYGLTRPNYKAADEI
jgi:hypothetical protein